MPALPDSFSSAVCYAAAFYALVVLWSRFGPNNVRIELFVWGYLANSTIASPYTYRRRAVVTYLVFLGGVELQQALQRDHTRGISEGAVSLHCFCSGILRTLGFQHKGGIFKVALFDRWLLVLTGKKYVEELRKFPDDQVSFLHGTAEVVTFTLLMCFL